MALFFQIPRFITLLELDSFSNRSRPTEHLIYIPIDVSLLKIYLNYIC